MKLLSLAQQHNQAYMGAQHTPDIEPYLYNVTKLTNATRPAIHSQLTHDEVVTLLEDKDWKVTIA